VGYLPVFWFRKAAAKVGSTEHSKPAAEAISLTCYNKLALRMNSVIILLMKIK